MVRKATEEKFSPEQLIDAIRREPGGIITNVARRLKAHPHTVRNYADRYPEVKQALEEAREAGIDLAESKLFEAIKAGEHWAIVFFLRHSREGRRRGYSERIELASSPETPIIVNLNRVPRRESLDEPAREN